MKLTQFFNTDYVDQASYDNLRKIASVVDGQKNAGRKILYTVLEKNINDKIKVSQLGSKVAEFAQYLHGSLDGVITGLAQDFAGTNNIPLLQKKGNFGTRHTNDPSASRYIYTYGSENFFNLFNSDDTPILKHQTFEGDKIEPMFYVPNLPMLLVNGSEGVSSGFAQKILPRDPKELVRYIKTGKGNLTPFYKGFTGGIEKGEKPGQWLIYGVCTRKSVNRVEISEVPVGYDLRTYINILDDLEDKKIIQSYKDLSEDDKFKFEVTVPSKLLKQWSDDQLYAKLKLVKKVTENYTVIDENNKIQVYERAEQLLDHYTRVKLEYTEKRKDHLIKKLEQEIRVDFSRYLFIKHVVEEKLIINKRKKKDIEADLEKITDIIKNPTYDYLLNMSIMSLTEERMAKLEDDIKDKKAQLDKLVNTEPRLLWLNEIKYK